MGDVDRVSTPSASIVLGKRIDCGTGAFELHTPLPSREADAVLKPVAERHARVTKHRNGVAA
eukprot:4860845-Pleurochrysis_carterae.AAC.2